MNDGVLGLIIGLLVGAYMAMMITHALTSRSFADDCRAREQFAFAHQKFECRATDQWINE